MTMDRLLLISMMVVVGACGGKDSTTDSTTDGDTTAAATTAGETTAEAPTSSSETTAEAPTSSGETTAGPGVVVEGPSSLCDENDPSEVPPSLSAMADGPGRIAVTEAGYETSCCLTLEPAVAVDGMTLNVSYTEVGDPCDCICYYTIDYTLTGLAAGSWTVTTGGGSVDVVVP